MIKNILCVFSILILFTSCENTQYEKEDLVLKFIKDNNELIKQEDGYYLLILRDLQMTCAQNHLGYQVDNVLTSVSDSLFENDINVISDDNYVNIGARMFFSNRKHIHFVPISYQEMDKYGFLRDPILFHIKDERILEWEFLVNN
jgi:hypothetical protein